MDNNIEDIIIEIGLDEASIESMFEDIDELDRLEELSMEKGSSDGIMDISLEAMGTDKFLNNLQKARRKFYGDFIKTNSRLYSNLSSWLRAEEIKEPSILAALSAAKKVGKKELGEVVASKMNGRYPNIISLINGVDPKQIKLAKSRFDDLRSRVKSNSMFIQKITVMIQKGSGFNALLDEKLKPIHLSNLIKEQYEDEPNLSASVNSIKLFGVRRVFKTDKKQILTDMMNAAGAKTVLLDWSGSTMKYLLINKEEMKVIYKKMKLTNTDYTSFYNRYKDTIKKTISDNAGADHLVEQMTKQLDAYNQVAASLTKLYMTRNKTYDELKYIRRYHMNLVRIIHFRLMDIVSTYKMIYAIGNVVTKEMS